MSQATSADKLAVFAELEDHIEVIQHYDGIQFFFRLINISILMGTFGTIGFLFTIDSRALPFSPIGIAIAICFFALLINMILSFLDLVLIERLIVSVFVDAVRLEKENPWLFPMHSRMNSIYESLSKKIKFYIGYSKDLLFLLLVCIFFLVWIDNWFWVVFVFMPVAVLSIYGYGKLLKSIAIRSEERLHQNLYDEIQELGEFEKWAMS